MKSVKLFEAFRFTEDEIAAFVGAGGKTTALFTTAREMASHCASHGLSKTVLVTTTTHIGSWQVKLADHFLQIKSSDPLSITEENLPSGVTLVFGQEENDRVSGLSKDHLDQLVDFAKKGHIPFLIEADGANRHPLKAPSMSEPVIPGYVRKVVVVAGMSGLNKPLSKNWVHRPELFADIAGLRIGDTVTSKAIAKELMSQDGGLKNIPDMAAKLVLLNQADTKESQSAGKTIASLVIPPFHEAIIASLRRPDQTQPEDIHPDVQDLRVYGVFEQIAGIILAAGSSSRLGVPKQLLGWKGEPFIRHVIKAAITAGLSPIIVVLGHLAAEVRASISDLPVTITDNSDWADGMSTSIRVGIKSLPGFTGGAVFMQADQPQTSPSLIRKLIEAHQTTLAPIISPQIDGERGNPVLFDRQTFPRLLDLKGDTGGRALFQNYSIHWVSWHDRNQLFDVDTMEDYQLFLDKLG